MCHSKLDSINAYVKHATIISHIVPKLMYNKTFDDLILAIQLCNLYQLLLPGSFVRLSRLNLNSSFNGKINGLIYIYIYNEDKTITISSNNDTPSFKRKLITVPNTTIDSLNEYNNQAFFLNIKILLQLFSTIPVSTAIAERSFSVFKINQELFTVYLLCPRTNEMIQL